MKLDLLNSRVEPAAPTRVFDSLEDASPPQLLSRKTLVSMTPAKVVPRVGSSKRLVAYASDRFDQSIVDNTGNKIFIKDRNPSRKKHPVVINFDRKHDSSNNSIASTLLEEFDNEKEFKIASEFHCSALDRIKDRIHDCNSHTIASKMAANKVAGVWSKAQRPIMARDEKSEIGPGYYAITNVNKRTIPAIAISELQREQAVVPEELLPLEKRLRLDRIRAQERSPERQRSRSRERSLSPDGGADSSPGRKDLASASKGSISTAPRFSGPEYKVEGYKKTSGMTLGPDWDAKFNKRIPFDMSKSQLSSCGRASSPPLPVADMDLDVERYFSTLSVVQTSPRKYASSFKSKAEVGLKLSIPTSGVEIGPGSYPNAFIPGIQVKGPDKLSLFFRGVEKGLDVRKAMPDGKEATKAFSDVNTKGPVFTSAQDPTKKKHIAAMAERKMSQIYPQLARKSFGLSSPTPNTRGSFLGGLLAEELSHSSHSNGTPFGGTSSDGRPSPKVLSPGVTFAFNTADLRSVLVPLNRKTRSSVKYQIT